MPNESAGSTTSSPKPPASRIESPRRLFVERVDLRDKDALLDIGRRHAIDGIVELAAAPSRPFGTVESIRHGMTVFLNVLEAGRAWGVRRISVASTIGVYGGVEGNPLREDAPLPSIPMHPIPAFKKAIEILSSSVAPGVGFEIANLRLAPWGPLFHHPPSSMNVPF